MQNAMRITSTLMSISRKTRGLTRKFQVGTTLTLIVENLDQYVLFVITWLHRRRTHSNQLYQHSLALYGMVCSMTQTCVNLLMLDMYSFSRCYASAFRSVVRRRWAYRSLVREESIYCYRKTGHDNPLGWWCVHQVLLTSILSTAVETIWKKRDALSIRMDQWSLDETWGSPWLRLHSITTNIVYATIVQPVGSWNRRASRNARLQGNK